MSHTEHDEPRGADLARIALLAAKKAAAQRGEHGRAQRKPSHRRTTLRGDGRDPMGLSGVIERLMAERGWEAPAAGGTVIDRWPAIATPEIAERLRAVAFDDTTRRLDLLPESPAWRLQGQLITAQLIRQANTEVGEGTVREIRILAAGSRPHHATEPGTAPAAAPPPEPTGPPRRYATDEYRKARAALHSEPVRHDNPAPVRTVRTRDDGYHQALAGIRTPLPRTEPAPVRTEEDRCAGYHAARAAIRTAPAPTPPSAPSPHEPPPQYWHALQSLRDSKVLSSPTT
ncbi:DciA family protein [Streptomyces yaizuensis]|uniref:DUF721 domain-containing protein n=1 Tax=Streptomyces yaizuensis TaxID=2989713 RepID=A0ABQ5P658_9ACTN|nr:DciA family protein [Streptomyces sp. YSPA8]GLF98073.1 DUF721 domain-containing protein [Streptomyces sp. YSPA8]